MRRLGKKNQQKQMNWNEQEQREKKWQYEGFAGGEEVGAARGYTKGSGSR